MMLHAWFCLCSDFEKEAKANAVLYRTIFGTTPKRRFGALQNTLDLYVKNPANTNVILWGNKLLALWEVPLSAVVVCVSQQASAHHD